MEKQLTEIKNEFNQRLKELEIYQHIFEPIVQEIATTKILIKKDEFGKSINENHKPQKVRILFLTANPLNTPRLRIDQEVCSIKEQLTDQFEVELCLATRVNKLQTYLRNFKPEIVHFSGHSTASSEIILEDDFGKSSSVPITALSNLFTILKKNIRCVVLNSCFSDPQAQAISEHIDCVIGKTNMMTDQAAIIFAAGFYGALGSGENIQTAFDCGCNLLDLNNFSAEDRPKLLAHNVNPCSVYLLKK